MQLSILVYEVSYSMFQRRCDVREEADETNNGGAGIHIHLGPDHEHVMFGSLTRANLRV